MKKVVLIILFIFIPSSIFSFRPKINMDIKVINDVQTYWGSEYAKQIRKISVWCIHGYKYLTYESGSNNTVSIIQMKDLNNKPIQCD